MIEHFLTQVLILLVTAVVVVVVFHRLRIPSSLGYLLVGVLLGSYTPGPVIDAQPVRNLAEFGIVFLLFAIGLNFSMPQIHAMRHVLLGLGTAQVLLTTATVGLLAWLLGLPVAAAFVVGAVFAQSSTTIIVKQLTEQGEENSRHGRLAIALNVFQDVTAVPFVVIFPVLATVAADASNGMGTMAIALGAAFAKAVFALVLVFLVGRWLLRPLFYLVAGQRSTEVFTMTVLLVSLAAAWTTHSLGLSMAFGAFLAGMMLGETEFRHQVESAIRPFRDVLVGLFFVGIGMLFDPSSLPKIWHWALMGAVILLLLKTVLVAQIIRVAGMDAMTAWRTGWVLAEGGEFGFALLAIALSVGIIDRQVGQIVLTAVLFSMIAAPFVIRYNHALARLCAPRPPRAVEQAAPQAIAANVGPLRGHVIVCGFGRIGQGVARFLEEERIPYVALDLDAERVRAAHIAGERVFYGDAGERDILEAVGVGTARLVVVSHEDVASAKKVLHHVRTLRPDLPVMVRTRDERPVEELRAAGATEVVPETLEAGLMIAVHALVLLEVPLARVVRRMQEMREGRYHLLRELFRGDSALIEEAEEGSTDELRPVELLPESPAVGRALQELGLEGVAITAMVRSGQRRLTPPGETRLEVGDVVVLFGAAEDLERAERVLAG
ncbi:MAG: cation:proton antiporter [Gammaproteobacteria bacterium]|nr:cation:proton antiporter [Gammaproteobacteria bacterium]MCG3144529.1 Glutathione-regulated potassium-efflux system protein KefC [Gammaproteobacteria bacterium]